MTWSLKVSGGDLQLSGGGMQTVTGEQKLVQDLRCFILERIGTDDLHPRYGSTLNGGTLPDGREAPGIIGESDLSFAELEIESEMRRMVRLYQADQLQRAQSDQTIYGKTTLSRGEVLVSLDAINIVQDQDTLHITLGVKTANNTGVGVDLALFFPPTVGS